MTQTPAEARGSSQNPGLRGGGCSRSEAREKPQPGPEGPLCSAARQTQRPRDKVCAPKWGCYCPECPQVRVPLSPPAGSHPLSTPALRAWEALPQRSLRAVPCGPVRGGPQQHGRHPEVGRAAKGALGARRCRQTEGSVRQTDGQGAWGRGRGTAPAKEKGTGALTQARARAAGRGPDPPGQEELWPGSA